MILVIPKINLVGGESINSISNENDENLYYENISNDPMALSMIWRKENAKCLYLVDNDSFEDRNNFLNTNAVLYLSDSVDIPIQYESNFTSVDECKMFLNGGIYRVVICDLAISDPEGVANLIREYTPSRVAFRSNIDNGFIYFKDLKKQLKSKEYASYVSKLGGNRIILSSENTNRNEIDNNYDELSEFADECQIKITIEGGIYNSEHLLKLSNLNNPLIDSCIIGKPLYENSFPCQAIWRNAEADNRITF